SCGIGNRTSWKLVLHRLPGLVGQRRADDTVRRNGSWAVGLIAVAHAIIVGMIGFLRTAALITIVLFATIAPAPAADWDRGVSYYKKSDYVRALVEFQDIVRERPDVAGAWYYIGLCQFKLNRYKQVQPAMSRAIDLLEAQSPASPDIEGAWYTIG